MQVFRLVRAPFVLPLWGKGAALKGGRWNSVGIELLYTATNRSLAIAEVAVHFSLATLPPDYLMVTLELPEGALIEKLNEKELPLQWKSFPPNSATQKLGDAFVLSNRALGLLVPSVVTQDDYNLLINPHHTQFAEVKVRTTEKFPFDHCIFAG